ncbi:hypothetical protein [Phyllobacterium endophyticum]|uniref:Uncharacterized protein n=1 Tax=Phyllobacterium endophyticum TaxID=1149773 RepID=A0A2P7AUL6_9HYPH|nr:hypothetical protein [Phyllobacterium endophyticum]MBB3234389.1 hypothetical protein [Phyllobacterium endophyticum]PSH57912.1 hypothetical protein CU100_09485 [Phyllobacterium endophyticum]TYR44119.1 hypothetical protein FY050_02835 [Phyllobacterium endophyticum]
MIQLNEDETNVVLPRQAVVFLCVENGGVAILEDEDGCETHTIFINGLVNLDVLIDALQAAREML